MECGSQWTDTKQVLKICPFLLVFWPAKEAVHCRNNCLKPLLVMLPASSLVTELFLFWQVWARAVRTNSHRCVIPLSCVTQGQTLLVTGAKAVAVTGYGSSRSSLLLWSMAF